jgi:hypothetical protein
MVEENTPDREEGQEEGREEVEPVDKDAPVRRKVREIIPTDPSPEVFEDEPPKLTIGGVFGIVKKKGLLGALSDDAWGPHVHLVMLLIIIFFIAVGVALVQLTQF